MQTDARAEALGATAFVAVAFLVFYFFDAYIPDWVIWALRAWGALWVLYQLFRLGSKVSRWLDK